MSLFVQTGLGSSVGKDIDGSLASTLESAALAAMDGVEQGKG